MLIIKNYSSGKDLNDIWLESEIINYCVREKPSIDNSHNNDYLERSYNEFNKTYSNPSEKLKKLNREAFCKQVIQEMRERKKSTVEEDKTDYRSQKYHNRHQVNHYNGKNRVFNPRQSTYNERKMNPMQSTYNLERLNPRQSTYNEGRTNQRQSTYNEGRMNTSTTYNVGRINQRQSTYSQNGSKKTYNIYNKDGSKKISYTL